MVMGQVRYYHTMQTIIESVWFMWVNNRGHLKEDRFICLKCYHYQIDVLWVNLEGILIGRYVQY